MSDDQQLGNTGQKWAARQPTLRIMRGLPGCGKTALAKQMVAAADPVGSVVRVNRDELRRMALPEGYAQPLKEAEFSITRAQHAAVFDLLCSRRDVICDDTNLPTRYVKSLMELAARAGAVVDIVDLTGVPLDVCIARDAAREGVAHVGEHVIRRMHDRYVAQHHGKPLPVPEATGATKDPYAAVEPYVRPEGAPPAFLIDMDGTTALMGDRSPYDETTVGDDLPNAPVILTARAWMDAGRVAIFMSGRTEGCLWETLGWLHTHVVRNGDRFLLYMRKAGDQRPDWQVKLELFNTHVRDRYRVEVAIDDRTQVVKLWRRLGIACWQVADGDF
jgi:predicted kinase